MHSKPTNLRFYWPLYCGGVKHFIWSELGLVAVKIVLQCLVCVCVVCVNSAVLCVVLRVLCCRCRCRTRGAAPWSPWLCRVWLGDHSAAGGDILQHLPIQQYTYFQTRAGLAISNASLTLNDINTQEWIYRLPGTACFSTPPWYQGKGLLVTGGSLQALTGHF